MKSRIGTVERQPGTKRSIVIQTFSGAISEYMVVRMADIVITRSLFGPLYAWSVTWVTSVGDFRGNRHISEKRANTKTFRFP